MITKLDVSKSIAWQIALREYSLTLKRYSNLSISNQVNKIFLAKNPDNIEFQTVRFDSNFNVEKFNFNFLMFQAAINFYTYLKVQLETEISRFISLVKNQDQKILKDIYYLNKVLLENKSKRLNLSNKSLVVNDFSDSANPNKLIDPKTNSNLRIYNLLDSGNQTLNLNKSAVYNITIKDIAIEQSLSTHGKVLNKSSLKNLLTEGEPFRHLLHVKVKDAYNRFANIEFCTLTISFKFLKPEKINSIKIKLASSLNIYLAKDCVKFLSLDNLWVPINSYNESIEDNIELFFETIQTKEIRIEFKLNRWLEEKTINDVYGRIYDFSIDQIGFFYSLYRDKGIFISNDYLKVNEFQNLKSELSYIFEDQDIVTELYFDVKLWNKYDFNSNLKVQSKIPYPLKRIIKERIVFSNTNSRINIFESPGAYINKQSNFLFPPKEKSIKIYKNGIEITDSNFLNKIYISNNKGASFTLLSSFDENLERNQNRELFNFDDFSIGFSSSIPNIRFSDVYTIEYERKDYFKYNKELIFEIDSISISNNEDTYIGYIVPIIMMRNLGFNNDSSSVVEKMFMYCIEKTSRDDAENLIEIEEQITNTYKGDGYVIV